MERAGSSFPGCVLKSRISPGLHFWNELLIPHPISSTRAPTFPSTGSVRQNQKLQAAKQVE